MTSWLLTLALAVSMTADLAVSAKASEIYEPTELQWEDMAQIAEEIEAITEILTNEAETIGYNGDIDELTDALNQLAFTFGASYPESVENTEYLAQSNILSTADGHTIKVGSTKLKNAMCDTAKGEITGDYLPVFKALGGKVKVDKKAGGVLYSMNNLTLAYPIAEDPKNITVTVSSILSQYGLDNNKDKMTVTEKHNWRTGITICTVTLPKPVLPPKAKHSLNVKEFFKGVTGAATENIQNGFFAWVCKAVTGVTVKKLPAPSSLKDPQSYYLGRVVGHAVSIALGVGGTVVGVAAIIGSIAAGGFTTLMSGGILTIAGLEIAVSGVTGGAAVAVDGSVLVGNAVMAMGNDWNGYSFYASNGNGGKGVKDISQSKLQHEFKHAPDFGVEGNWSKANGEAFKQAIYNHIYRVENAIKGTYRGNTSVTHYFDPTNNLNVMLDSKGNYIGGWKLSVEQVANLLRNGNIQ